MDGKVLVVGGRGANDGELASAELYDPATGKWSSCSQVQTSGDCPGPLGSGRYDHTATLLKDGRVLVAGGSPPNEQVRGRLQTTEIYDPATGRWSTTGPLNVSRGQHTATLLADSKVLVTGGVGLGLPGDPEEKSSTELYDPSTAKWSSCPNPVPMPSPDCPGPLFQRRYEHTATRLDNGKVVVAGGTTNSASLTSAEYYDPATGTWQVTDPLPEARAGHAAVLLPSDEVLVGGGDDFRLGGDRVLSSAELYDPFSGHWGSAGAMNDARSSDFFQPRSVQAVLLSSQADTFGADPALCGNRCGKVLVVGGIPDPGDGSVPPPPVASAELYTPVPKITALSPRSGPAAGGTEVTIEGRGFTHKVSAVKFGDTPAQSFTVDSYSKLRAVSPPSAAGASVPVTVVNEGGVAVSGDRFTYTGGAAGGGILGAVQSAADKALAAAQAAQARRTSDLRSCLAAVASHASRERKLARRGSARKRARARRHLKRHAVSGRRRCLRLYGRTPGRITGLTARALSNTQIELSFSAAGSDGDRPPPARSYLVKQSTRPIRSARDFSRARTLCGGICRFNVTRPGGKISLAVTDLRAHTTYYYAVAARDNVSARLGPRSGAVRTRTR